MKYLLTGGGTGGHVYPALAIKELIASADKHAEFLYVGVSGKAEEHILGSLKNDEKIPLQFIRARGLPRIAHIAKFWKFIRDFLIGFKESRMIIRSFDPDIIIATGGYVTAPVVLAGRFAGKKLLLHEQNSIPGLVNRVLSRFASRVLVTFPETEFAFSPGKAIAAGYPVRRRIKAQSKESARSRLKLPINASVVFIFGGSSGAHIINEAVVRNLELFLAHENVIVIHGTGRDQAGGIHLYSDTRSLLLNLFPLPNTPNTAQAAQAPPSENRRQIPHRYIMRDYFHDIDTIYSAADLAVCRAGAGTIMECAALGLPMILVPKSGLPGDHQVENAQIVEKAGGAVIVREERFKDQTILDGERLIHTIIETVHNKPLLIEMSKNLDKIYKSDSNDCILSEIKRLTASQ